MNIHHHHDHRHHDQHDGHHGHRRGRGGHRFRRDGSGHGRRRARRGAVGTAVLALLEEQPMYGYELITALEDKSGGRWKPSAGSIYPALRRLEHRGFVSSVEGDDGKRRFELTDLGRERVAEHRDAGHAAPWDEHGLGRHGELRRAVSELSGPARQIGRFGSTDQTERAVAVVKDATAQLYRILADGPAEPDRWLTDDAADADDAAGDAADDTADSRTDAGAGRPGDIDI